MTRSRLQNAMTILKMGLLVIVLGLLLANAAGASTPYYGFNNMNKTTPGAALKCIPISAFGLACSYNETINAQHPSGSYFYKNSGQGTEFYGFRTDGGSYYGVDEYRVGSWATFPGSWGIPPSLAVCQGETQATDYVQCAVP